MNKAIFITARVGSSRLPQKHLLKINGKHCIEHVFRRAKYSKKADLIVLCTTTLREDDILVFLAEQYDIKVFRGSVEDKMDRWRGASEKFDVECFCTMDADDILASPDLMDLAFEQYEKNDTDIIDWALNKDLICGSFTYCIKTSLLNKYCFSKKTNKTEMSAELLKHLPLCKADPLYNVPEEYKRSDIRLTLDYIYDFCLFVNIFQKFDKCEEKINLYDVVEFLDRNPWLIKLNQHCHKEWRENQLRILSHENMHKM